MTAKRECDKSIRAATVSMRLPLLALILVGTAWCPGGHLVVAAAAEGPAGMHIGPTTNQPAMRGTSTQPSVAATRPADRLGSSQYTRPSNVIIGSLSGKPGGGGARMIGSGVTARQASEASVSASSLSATGTAGLAAPQPRTLTTVNSIPGIQRGYAAGLGFANRQNILTWQRNPADRPCQDLVRAGFFPSVGMCRRGR